MNISLAYIANATYLMVQDNRAYPAATAGYAPADQADQETAVNEPEISFPKRPAEQATTSGPPQGTETSSSPGKSGRKPSDTASGNNGNGLNDSVSFSDEALKVKELQARDQEVRVHEAAHASVGGQYAGSPHYTYEKGPDGVQYAVSGEVPIDTSPIAGDPRATISKADRIRAAALAPASPSAADRAIAAKASRMAAQARTELLAAAGGNEAPGRGMKKIHGPEKSGQTGNPAAAYQAIAESTRPLAFPGSHLNLWF